MHSKLRFPLQNQGFGTWISTPPIFSHLTQTWCWPMAWGPGGSPGRARTRGHRSKSPNSSPTRCRGLKPFQLVPQAASPSPCGELPSSATSCTTPRRRLFLQLWGTGKGIWARGTLPFPAKLNNYSSKQYQEQLRSAASPLRRGTHRGVPCASRQDPAQRRGIHLPSVPVCCLNCNERSSPSSPKRY